VEYAELGIRGDGVETLTSEELNTAIPSRDLE